MNENEEEQDKLSIENEILKMKLQMKFGDDFMMKTNGSMPVELENQFLKQIMAFEENYENIETITVFERIGNPDFKKVEELTSAEVSKELGRVNELMESKGIILNICDGPYEDAVIYKFITEELFLQNVGKESDENSMCNFIYEEFYLNDKAEIIKNVHEFMAHWFARKFNENDYELADTMVTAEGKAMPLSEMFKKISLFFDAFETFKNDEYSIDEVSFQMQTEDSGMGHAEGMVKYDAILDNGEVVQFEGGYKLYMQRQGDWWEIFYFIMPGFIW